MACISGFMYQCLYKMVSLSGDHIGLKYSKHPVYHTYFEWHKCAKKNKTKTSWMTLIDNAMPYSWHSVTVPMEEEMYL